MLIARKKDEHDAYHGITAFPVCPEDGSPWQFYDGALGYESLTCPQCGMDINDITLVDYMHGHYTHVVLKEIKHHE